MRTCATPIAPTNGSVVLPVEFVSGTVATFTCDRGHSLSGSASMVCLLNGQYSSPIPTCDAYQFKVRR